jgi:hypothetical protein
MPASGRSAARARLFRKRYAFISHACLDHGRLKRTYRKHPLTFTLAGALILFFG